jgi:phage shock protein PspC (stress-responsive transcriptional regulator)
MNKTVTINISGIIFHIEEDAYEKLGNYLKTVRNRFSAEDGRDEIMMDIEARVAEILQGKTSASKQVVVMADVDYVISLMGEPEAISDQEEKPEEKTAKEKEEAAHSGTRTRRRLYRDTDDKVVGGVCSGLGYYFDLDPVWIRIGFAVSFFVFGTGFLFYILLLIIIPKAETTAEKLEMRGEPVDVNNISRTIKEEFSGFKKKAEDFGEDIKNRGKKWKDESREYWRSRRVRDGFEDFFHGVFRVMGRVFGFLLLFFGVLFLIGLLTSTFSLSDLGPTVISSNFSNLFSDSLHYGLALCAFILLFGIPILMMIYKGIRILFRINRPDKIIGISALSLWVLGIIFTIISIVNALGSFTESNTTHENISLPKSHFGALYLAVNIDKDMANADYNSNWNRRFHYSRSWKMVSMNDKDLKLGYPDLNIVKSYGDSVELVIFKSARGRDRREAMQNAREIHYTVNVKDSLITFSNYFTLEEQSKFRAQEVHAELRIPVNTIVFLDFSMRGILYDIDNVSNTSDNEMVGRRWKMTERGLQCVDCEGLDMRENGNTNALPQPQKSDSLPANKKNDTIIIHH